MRGESQDGVMTTKTNAWTTGHTTTSITLGTRGPRTSALGVGTWALGGPFTVNGRDAGWGEVDDDVSVAALHAAVEAGVRLIDTADSYGAGHSERVVGRALRALSPALRDEITVATKFGNLTDEATRTGGGTDVTPTGIHRACRDSLERLQTDAIDVYQLHTGAQTAAEADDVIAALETLVDDGLVRWYGTAVEAPEVVRAFAAAPHAVTAQMQVNVFGWSAASLDAALTGGLTVFARSPLAMGLLGGRYDAAHRPAAGDVRLDTPWWDYFDEDAMPAWLDRVAAVRDLLTAGGRTLAQGALGYLLAMRVVPIPGARTPEQAAQNSAALAFGPLDDATARQVDALLADSPERR